MISEHILLPYSCLNPWSKYVPMPQRQKGPTRLSSTHLWHFRGGVVQAIPKSLCQAIATRRVCWTKDVHKVCFRLFNWGREQKSKKKNPISWDLLFGV